MKVKISKKTVKKTAKKRTQRAYDSGSALSDFVRIKYDWLGEIFETEVPGHWPEDAVAEVCAFRAGAAPGDEFEFVGDTDDDQEPRILVGTGESG